MLDFITSGPDGIMLSKPFNGDMNVGVHGGVDTVAVCSKAMTAILGTTMGNSTGESQWKKLCRIAISVRPVNKRERGYSFLIELSGTGF